MGVDVSRFVGRLDEALRAAGRPERAAQEARYLKSALEHYGTSVPATRAATKAVLGDGPELDHDDLVAVVEALWETPVHERRMAAVEPLSDPQRAAVLAARA
jgi:hypothetical protein